MVACLETSACSLDSLQSNRKFAALGLSLPCWSIVEDRVQVAATGEHSEPSATTIVLPLRRLTGMRIG